MKVGSSSSGSSFALFCYCWLQRYRQAGVHSWIPVDVDPPMSTHAEIHNLQPGTVYEFQVVGKNVLGDGMYSNLVTERTKGIFQFKSIFQVNCFILITFDNIRLETKSGRILPLNCLTKYDRT